MIKAIASKKNVTLFTLLAFLLSQLPSLCGLAVHWHAAVLAQAGLVCVANTGEKPQSKVWTHAGEWWRVLPSSSASSSGTWLWKLQGTTWVEVLKLSNETGTKADVETVGDVAHILLYDSDPELVSVEYVGGTYQLWNTRPTPSPISLPSSEIATIDVDSTGRMWLATESGTDIVVHYSDSPYSTWNGPIKLASGVNSDDISVVTALPNNTIGVLWSNQSAKAFGFRVHVDGAAPTVWSTDEVPASGGSGNGIADDHVNVAVASDGTLYAAVKTEEAGDNANLLVRRPAGTWDPMYQVDTSGTRPIVVLNEAAGVLRVIYTSSTGGGDIVYKETALSPIDFSGPRSTLIGGGGINNASSTKQNYTDELVVIASDSSNTYGVHLHFTVAGRAL